MDMYCYQYGTLYIHNIEQNLIIKQFSQIILKLSFYFTSISRQS
ncbi:protein of unknown function [Clostridium beijerinckii]|nr:protein of unknown function [Clostridium beijerinckii]